MATPSLSKNWLNTEVKKPKLRVRAYLSSAGSGSNSTVGLNVRFRNCKEEEEAEEEEEEEGDGGQIQVWRLRVVHVVWALFTHHHLARDVVLERGRVLEPIVPRWRARPPPPPRPRRRRGPAGLQRLVAAVPPEPAARALALGGRLAVALHPDGRPLRLRRQPLGHLLPLRPAVRHPARVFGWIRPPSSRCIKNSAPGL